MKQKLSELMNTIMKWKTHQKELIVDPDKNERIRDLERWNDGKHPIRTEKGNKFKK